VSGIMVPGHGLASRFVFMPKNIPLAPEFGTGYCSVGGGEVVEALLAALARPPQPAMVRTAGSKVMQRQTSNPFRNGGKRLERGMFSCFICHVVCGSVADSKT